MTLKEILREIDAEIARLEQAKNILSDHSGKGAAGLPPKKKRVQSDEARRRIAEAQKKRWRKQKKAAAHEA